MIIEYNSSISQNYTLFPIWNYSFIEPDTGVVVPTPTPMSIGGGLSAVQYYGFAKIVYPQTILPIIKTNFLSSAHIEILVDEAGITEVDSLTGSIFLVSPPGSSSNSWESSGLDISSGTTLSLESKRNYDGKIIITARINISSVNRVEFWPYYGIIIYLNSGSSASSPQAAIEAILKINNSIEV